MKRIATCLSVLIFACYGLPAAVYFVGHNGDDTAAGTLERPWFSIEKSVARLIPGDTLFIREGIYRQKFDIHISGNPDKWITIRNYDDEEVNIWYAVDLSDQQKWEQTGTDRWCTRAGVFTAEMNYDLATLWVDDHSHWSHKKTSPDALRKQWDFYQDHEKQRIEVFSSSNPALIAKHIEAPRSRAVAPYQFVTNIYGSYLLMEGIHYRYINVHGIKVAGGAHHFTFRNGSITHGGGGNISPTYTPAVRWGDCVDITNETHHIRFEHSVFGKFPDGTLTNQGTNGQQRYLYLRNNYIYNSTNGIHCWFGESGAENKGVALRNIYYEGNTFEGIGKGWFEDQAVMIGGIQFIPRENVITDGIFIRDNLFIDCGATNYNGNTWRGVNCPVNIGGGNLIIRDNIIYNSPMYGIFVRKVHQDFTGEIANNLLVNCALPGIHFQNDQSRKLARIHNNLDVDIDGQFLPAVPFLAREAANYFSGLQEQLEINAFPAKRNDCRQVKILLNGYDSAECPTLTIRTREGKHVITYRIVTPPGSVNIWDCTDAHGNNLPAGEYSMELKAGEKTATGVITVEPLRL